MPRYPEEVVLRQQGSINKPILQRSSIPYVEQTTDDKKKENNMNGNLTNFDLKKWKKYKSSSENMNKFYEIFCSQKERQHL